MTNDRRTTLAKTTNQSVAPLVTSIDGTGREKEFSSLHLRSVLSYSYRCHLTSNFASFRLDERVMVDLIGLIRFWINLILYPFALTFLVFFRCLQWLGLQPMNYDHQDQLVLITGAAGGLGREIAYAFARAENGAAGTLTMPECEKLSSNVWRY